MKETIIKQTKKVKMNKPVLIEGLPGIGLVGKLAADLMVDELKAEKVAELYSPHFPHQVVMQKSGIIKTIKNEFYLVRRQNKLPDLLILVGDVQAITSEAQYEINGKIIEYLKNNGGSFIITLGGYGTGKGTKDPKIFGAATNKSLVDKYANFGVLFGKTSGSIIGAAGLLLALGRMEKIPGVCIMGETHGGYVDANAAKKMINILSKILNIKVSTKKLEKKALENKKLLKKLQEEQLKEQQAIISMGEPRLSYIR